ncbi:MAG TPA: GrpB family protein [Candidatus Limnocylindria bacterium]|nr:GrpB family protein [Candidatus Limnocylindria bacterium]
MDSDEPGREFRGGLIVGAQRDEEPIELADYDGTWPARFDALRARLAAALGDVALRIDHVGSTAVAGLAAKPVVDVQVSVPDVEDEAAYRVRIESLGFGLRYREPGHRYFRPPPGLPRLSHIHVCTTGSDWEHDHLLFRDYLRAHPAAAADYAKLKRRAAAEHPTDRIAYTDAKGPWIKAIVERARAWAQRTGWRG